MKNVILLSLLFLLSGLPSRSDAQLASLYENKPVREKKWMLSFSLGNTLDSPGKDLEKAMINSGFDNYTPIVTTTEWFFGLSFTTTSGGDKYPQRRSKSAIGQLELRYLLSDRSSIGLSYAGGLSSEVEGYYARGHAGNFIHLRDYTSFVSLTYMISTGSRGGGFSIGPSMAIHQLDQELQWMQTEAYHHKAVKPGIHTGYTLPLIQSQTGNVLIGLNLSYDWYLKDKIDAISVEVATTNVNNEPIVFTSVFESDPIRLVNKNIGLSFRFKL